jgi:hypothetical protein
MLEPNLLHLGSWFPDGLFRLATIVAKGQPFASTWNLIAEGLSSPQ